MDGVLVALGLFPLFATIVLLGINLRRQWHHLSAGPIVRPYWGTDEDDGPPDAGVREPRRPLVPAGTGGESLGVPAEIAEDDAPSLGSRGLANRNTPPERLAG